MAFYKPAGFTLVNGEWERTVRVQVTEPSTLIWTGTKLWEEKGSGTDIWYVVRPDDYAVHVKRGSGTRECEENLVRVPNFLNGIKHL